MLAQNDLALQQLFPSCYLHGKQPMHMGEHAFLRLQGVRKVQQDPKEAICHCQQQDHASQTGVLNGQLRQRQCKGCAKHDDDHDLHSTDQIRSQSQFSHVLKSTAPQMCALSKISLMHPIQGTAFWDRVDKSTWCQFIQKHPPHMQAHYCIGFAVALQAATVWLTLAFLNLSLAVQRAPKTA